MGVLHVGDSLGVGTGPFLRARTDAVGGRSSAQVLEALKKQLRDDDDAVIFDAGTNDQSAHQLAASVQRARRLAGDRPLYMATIRGPAAKQKNKLLRRLAQRGEIRLVNWAGKAPPGGDGIHPDSRGYRKRARMFERALQTRQQEGQPIHPTRVAELARNGLQASQGVELPDDPAEDVLGGLLLPKGLLGG